MFSDGQPLNMIVDDGADLTRTVHEKFPHLLAGKCCRLQLAGAGVPHEYYYFQGGGVVLALQSGRGTAIQVRCDPQCAFYCV